MCRTRGLLCRRLGGCAPSSGVEAPHHGSGLKGWLEKGPPSLCPRGRDGGSEHSTKLLCSDAGCFLQSPCEAAGHRSSTRAHSGRGNPRGPRVPTSTYSTSCLNSRWCRCLAPTHDRGCLPVTLPPQRPGGAWEPDPLNVISH